MTRAPGARSIAAQALGGGVHRRRNFLSPFGMVAVLDAAERLSSAWTTSEAMGLLGRGGTTQIPPRGAAALAQLDLIRHQLAQPTLQWAKTCGFAFAAPPHLSLFPVRMNGNAASPAYQEPHVDSNSGWPGPPLVTNVFYVRASGVEGGDLVVGAGDPGRAQPIRVRPEANMVVSFAGDRVHWVEPLYAGERLSVVVNFY